MNTTTTDGWEDERHLLYNEYTIALVPKIPALLSMLSSYVVIRECLADLQISNKAGTYGRASGGVQSPPLVRTLIAMSIADLFFSFPWFMTTWMAPSDVGADYYWLQYNVGTTATCTLQGTIFSFGIVSVPLFNVMFTFFSLMMVRYQWRDHQLIKLEPWLHFCIWTTAVTVATFPTPLQLYNPSESICWFESYPYECKDSFTHGEEATCTRGDNAWIFHVAFTIFPAWLCFLLSIILMAMIHYRVRHLELRVSKYTRSTIVSQSRASATIAAAAATDYTETGGSACMANPTNLEQQEAPPPPAINRTKSEAVARRALWLASAFLLTYLLDLLAVILWYVLGIYSPGLDFFAYLLYPLQGFMNLVIFLHKRQTMRTPEGRVTQRLFGCLHNASWRCCHCCCQSNGEPSSPQACTTQQTQQQSLPSSTENKDCLVEPCESEVSLDDEM